MYRHFSTAIKLFFTSTGKLVVKRMSGNSRKCKAQRTYRCSVSQAVWPSHLQHCIATNRAAQRRRAIVMKGCWWLISWYNSCRNPKRSRLITKCLCCYTSIVKPIRQQLTTALITSVFLLCIYLLYQWYVWSPVIIIGILFCTLLFLILAEKRHGSKVAQTLSNPQHEASTPQTTPFEFPETPVPATPLIRVMDTIDLSASDIEHFIRTTADQQEQSSQQIEESSAHQMEHGCQALEQTSDQQQLHDA
jgi:hypothetical protein